MGGICIKMRVYLIQPEWNDRTEFQTGQYITYCN